VLLFVVAAERRPFIAGREMYSVVKAAIDLRNFKCNFDDDLVDRLNRQYTPIILVLFTVIVTARHYIGDAMHCWCPEVRRTTTK